MSASGYWWMVSIASSVALLGMRMSVMPAGRRAGGRADDHQQEVGLVAATAINDQVSEAGGQGMLNDRLRGG